MTITQKWKLGDVVLAHCPTCGKRWRAVGPDGGNVRLDFGKLFGHCPLCRRELERRERRCET